MKMNWIDKTIGYFSPKAALTRVRARAAVDLLVRHYEAASMGRRTQGWRSSSGDANAVMTGVLGRLRDRARDLVRNNGYADSALDTIADQTVGWGIVAKILEPKNKKIQDLWKAWSETTVCDSDGINNFAGLQHLVMRTVAESGEVLIRLRPRMLDDGLPIPFQIQVLEVDYIDSDRHGIRLPNGGRIIHGVEFNVLGRRVAYWLFPEHPGSEVFVAGSSVRVPSENVLHVYFKKRPNQVRGATWFATSLLKFKDFDEFDDATLVKQKIAACLAVLTTDPDGSGTPIGTAENDGTNPTDTDSLEPGLILNLPPGRDITVVNPPSVGEYADYTRMNLHAIATAIGVTYEDLTGDYSGLNFSSARMSRLRHYARVNKWRWQMLVPMFCEPVWQRAMQLAQIVSGVDTTSAKSHWTAPPPPMIDPANEGLAIQRNIRTGVTTFSEMLREQGWDPEEFMKEYSADLKMLDKYEITLDSDARKRTQAGNPATASQTATPSDPEPVEDDPNADIKEKKEKEKKEKED